jgi:ankyrin repeat protein
MEREGKGGKGRSKEFFVEIFKKLGQTPLHLACASYCVIDGGEDQLVDFARMLIEAGADVNAKVGEGEQSEEEGGGKEERGSGRVKEDTRREGRGGTPGKGDLLLNSK